MEKGYPVMLDIQGAKCAVIGGGKVALRKISALLDSGADVVVVSPSVHPTISEWERGGRVQVVLRGYGGPDDLYGARLVFTATDAEEVNAAVCRDAAELGIPANDAGCPERGTFIAPAVLRRGGLVLTVSTSGASPGLASKLRRELEERYGGEYEAYVDFLAELRGRVLEKIDDPAMKAAIFQNVLKFDILEVIREGRLEAYRTRVWAMLDEKIEPDWSLDDETTCGGGQPAKRARSDSDESSD